MEQRLIWGMPSAEKQVLYKHHVKPEPQPALAKRGVRLLPVKNLVVGTFEHTKNESKIMSFSLFFLAFLRNLS